MRDLNKVLLMGRVGAKPLGRTTAKGHRLASFPVATARRRKESPPAVEGVVREGGGALDRDTDWHQVIAWGTLARICEDHVQVGQQIYIEGTVHHHTYSVEVDGQKSWRKVSEIYADQVRFLGHTRRGRDAAEEEADVAGVEGGADPRVQEVVSLPAPAGETAEVA